MPLDEHIIFLLQEAEQIAHLLVLRNKVTIQGEVEKLVFGDKPHPTDDDPRRRHFDDRDFRDAAGTRTGLGTKDSTAGSMEAPLTFEQIPHSKFVPYRRKANVPTTGSMGEEIMYNREADSSDHLDTSVPMYLGAAGETTQKSALRYEREQLNGNKAVRPGNSVIDSLVFMHDMDNSEADDAYVERLYEGCFGNRASGPNVHHPYDVSTRRRDHLTGDKIYGFNSVHGTDLDGDAEVVDPRDRLPHIRPGQQRRLPGGHLPERRYVPVRSGLVPDARRL